MQLVSSDAAADAAAAALSTSRELVNSVPASSLAMATQVAGGAVFLGAAAYAASIMLGHHVDVSVFIV